MYRQGLTGDFANEILSLHNTVYSQELLIDELELKVAWYKALFFHKDNLAYKMHVQIMENWRNRHGYGCMTYRTLDDMLVEGLITKEECEFCKV